jgi:parallel beta-helix repeat protein
MWALDGATFDNIRIDGNWFQESTDAKRPLQNELQGIDDFDGVNTHVVITNNVVLASAYHGIALYGSQDSIIDHNTVANPTANGHKLWVGVFDTKGSMPSKNVTAKDNAAVSFSFSMATTGFVDTNNVAVPDPTAAYTTFDTTKMIFDLTPKPGGILAGKGAGSSLVKPPASLP